jgi:cold shock CspA family protein
MFVIGKYFDEKKNIKFVTFADQRDAFGFIEENSGSLDIELFVNISEVQHYRDRYFEGYKVLFSNFSSNEIPDEILDDMVTSVKFYDIQDNIERFKSFSCYEDAKEFIDDELSDIDRFGGTQLLVNISQVLDYKEKYEQFYQLLLDKTIDRNLSEKDKDF